MPDKRRPRPTSRPRPSDDLEGELHSHGTRKAEVDRAKADGRWEAAYDGAKTATVPDVAAALIADPTAAAFFETLDRQNRYAILYRVQDAKKPETRARRIEKYAAPSLSVPKRQRP